MTSQASDKQLVTLVLLGIGAVLLMPLLFMGIAMLGLGPIMGGMWMESAVPGWIVLIGIIMPLLFVAVLIGIGYLLYRALTSAGDDTDQPLEELRLAYARGELTDEEYEQRKAALEDDT